MLSQFLLKLKDNSCIDVYVVISCLHNISKELQSFRESMKSWNLIVQTTIFPELVFKTQRFINQVGICITFILRHKSSVCQFCFWVSSKMKSLNVKHSLFKAPSALLYSKNVRLIIPVGTAIFWPFVGDIELTCITKSLNFSPRAFQELQNEETSEWGKCDIRLKMWSLARWLVISVTLTMTRLLLIGQAGLKLLISCTPASEVDTEWCINHTKHQVMQECRGECLDWFQLSGSLQWLK